MEKPQKMEHALKLQNQLKIIKPKYDALLNEIEDMHSNLRVHLSTIVAAFLSIIASLHHASSNICKEWLFFICILFCVLSLIFLLLSSFENLHNTIALRDKIKATYDKAIDTMTPINNISFSSPREKVYSVYFWLGIITFGIALFLFCIINMPIW